MTLQLATSGPCAGHRCDNCPQCQAGECCGADVYEAWAEQPDPTAPAYGTAGLWHVDDDGRIQCHICGQHFHDLGRHAATTHNTPAAAYRALYGFTPTAPLASAKLRAIRAANAATRLDPNRRAELVDNLDNVRPTPEQLSVIAYRREATPRMRAYRKDHPPPNPSDGAAALHAKRAADPVFSGQIRRRAIAARRRHRDYTQRCPVCGWTFCAIRYRGQQPKTCRTPECLTEIRRRAYNARKDRAPV